MQPKSSSLNQGRGHWARSEKRATPSKSFVHVPSPAALPTTFQRGPLPVRASDTPSASSSSARGFGAPAKQTMRQEAKESNVEVYDRLISVFREKEKTEWRKLIAFSKQWVKLSEGVFKRIDEQSRAPDLGPDEQLALRSMLKSLKIAHEDVKRYNELIQVFRDALPREWDGLVAQRRGDLRPEFFDHIRFMMASATANKNAVEHDALNAMASRLVTLMEAYDQVAKDEAAMRDAGSRLHEFLSQVQSVEDAEMKIDQMAEQGRLDPAFLLTMAKAYAAAKDSSLTKPDVMDIMAHMYFKAQETAARQQPPEVRILKYLLSVEDPLQRHAELEEAFKPGAPMETSTQDFLTTTPERLLQTVETVLATYETQKTRSTVLGETAKMMNPVVIQRLKELQQRIRSKYM